MSGLDLAWLALIATGSQLVAVAVMAHLNWHTQLAVLERMRVMRLAERETPTQRAQRLKEEGAATARATVDAWSAIVARQQAAGIHQAVTESVEKRRQP